MSLFTKKTLTFLLIAVGLVGAVVWQVGGVSGSSSYEARFARAMKLMEGLQSRAIPVAFTEDEIDLLEGVYQDSLVRLPNVTNFRNTDKGKLIDQLKAHGLSGTGTNGLSVSGEKVVATALARTDSFKTEIDVVINNIDVPVNNDTKVLIKKLSRSINTLTNDVRLTMLYISWYEALRGTLCTTDDVNNDIYTLGTLSFRYGTTTALVDSCSGDNVTLTQHRCVLGQYKNEPTYVTTTACANGCSNGACIRESQSGFELTGPDSVGVSESFSIDVKAVNASGQTDTGYTGTFFVIIAGDDDAIFPAGALNMSGTGMKRINGIKFSQEGIMTITVRSTDGYEASKTVVVGATHPDAVSCTVVNDVFQFKHSNGSTNFSNQIISFGGADPYVVKYEIEYSQTQLIFKADVYIDGIPVSCPQIAVEQNPEAQNEPPETCSDMMEGLLSEGEDTSGMRCTGQYSFTVEQQIQKPESSQTLSGLVSSFLSSNILPSDGNDDCTINGNCGENTYYSCGPNQTEVGGQCVDDCSSPNEMVNGICTSECTYPQERDSWGNCADPACDSPNEMVNGTCMPECISPEVRNSDGYCESPAYCGNGIVESGEECDEGSYTDYCDSSCHSITQYYCGDGNVSDGEECDDGNTSGGDGCSSSCQNESGYCGDGTVDAGEECDDGNTSGGDGCDASCTEECGGPGNSLGSSFFGFTGWNALKSSTLSTQNCPKKGCTIKAAQNYVGSQPEYEDDNSCECKNGLDPYTYDNCRCQPTYAWCYHPKGGQCVKARFVRKFIVRLIRGSPSTALAATTGGAGKLIPIPDIPMAADFKLYKPQSVKEWFGITASKDENGNLVIDC